MSDHLDLVSRLDALLDSAPVPGPPELLPARLALAASTVLAVDGASLSLLSLDLRVSLGASDADAGAAERLQFTHGEGPGLDVPGPARAVWCTLPQMQLTWPAFARELTSTTPYRSVASVPLPFDAGGDGGALDLYARHPEGCGRIDVDGVAVVANRIVEHLIGSQSPSALAGVDDASKVPWLQAPDTRRRMEVWVAIGVLTARYSLDTAEALTVLRGWAHTHQVDVDTVAVDIAAGRLDPDLLQP